MGTLDQGTASNVKREIKIVDVTGYTPAQVETYFNQNVGNKGWRIIQFVIAASAQYILAEREYQ